MNNKQPNCFKCVHFYITHQPAHPYGCHALGFKAKQLPAQVTFINSGIPCQFFSPK